MDLDAASTTAARQAGDCALLLIEVPATIESLEKDQSWMLVVEGATQPDGFFGSTTMPMHDWTCVSAGTYHDFHNSWITHLKEAFNTGLLPPAYYALGEQRSGDIEPDVVAEEVTFYLQRRRTLVIRHSSGDRVAALIEIVSPANKHTHRTIEAFADKLVAALRDGIHVLVIDPFPPTRHDPVGMHGVIWERILAGDYQQSHDLSLTLVSYCVRQPITAYVEPFCVGRKLVDMPLFLTPEHYIPVPLESTYMQAWAGVPNRWRRVIEQET